MRIRRAPDGSLEIFESPIVARIAMLVGAVAIPWAVMTSRPPSSGHRLDIMLGFVAGAFMLLGALLVETRRFRFDRAEQRLHWQRSRLIGKRAGTLAFSEIRSAVAQPRMEDDNPRTRRLSYRPVLLTREGEIVLSNTSSLNVKDYETLLSQIREVIGLTDAGPTDPIVDLVRAGRLIDATKILRRQGDLSLEEAQQRVRQIQLDLQNQG